MTTYFDYPDLDPTLRAMWARSPFLHGCDRRAWATLRRHSTLERVVAGATVFERGAADRSLYVLLDGALVVDGPRGRHGRQVLQPGDVFGELSFFDGLPRSATVRATEDAHVLRIRHDNFDVLAAHDPALARRLLLDLGAALAARVRAAQADRH